MKVYETASVDVRSPLAWAWAKKLADYCNENYEGVTVEVLQQVTGPGNRITFVSGHDSLGKAELFIEWYGADEGFQNLLLETAEQELVNWETFSRSFFRVR